MIVEWLVGVAAGFVDWLAGLFGEWTPPVELTGAVGAAQSVIATFDGMGVWIDWTVLGVCIAASLLGWGSVLAIKLIRAIAAHIPIIGGAGD